MTVTEFALMKLRESFDDLEFLELIMQCQETQDAWSRQHHPHALSNKPYSTLSSFVLQKTNPRFLLITAPWDSPDAHREWIESKENQSAFAQLSTYIAPTCDSVLLFHMEPAGSQIELRGDLLAKDRFNVCRLSVPPSQKEALQSKYKSIEEQVLQEAPGHRIWAGWRIETVGEEEDLIVFWSPSVPQEQLQGLLDMADKKDTRVFELIV